MNILLVQTGFLGDVILSTAVIEQLQELFPTSNLSVMTTPQAAPLVAHHPFVKSVIVYDKRKKDKGMVSFFRFVRTIRAERFEIVFSLHKSYRTALLLFLSGIPRRFGFAEAALSSLYTKVSPRKDLQHEVLRNLAIFRNIGLEPEETKAELCIALPKEARVSAQSYLEASKIKIGIAPGSVWRTKRWKLEGFIDVTREMLRKGYQVILCGGKEDSLLGEKIEEACPGVTNAVGKTDILTSCALISELDVLVTNDSAPLHMASAHNVPTVALFCATVPGFGFGPWKNRAEVLGVEGLSCRPCGRHGGNTCPTGTHACQNDLLSRTVIDGVGRILGEGQCKNEIQKNNILQSLG